MSEQTQTVIVRKTKSGSGYTLGSKIGKEHFTTLKSNGILTPFQSKDKDTGEAVKNDAGKAIWINFIPAAQFEALETYCKSNNMELTVQETNSD